MVIQDPVWEQSYPDIGGLVVAFEPPDGTAGGGLVRLSTAEADWRREDNEERAGTCSTGCGRSISSPCSSRRTSTATSSTRS